MDKPLPINFRKLGCAECLDSTGLGFDFTMAFQPIVDIQRKTVFAHEALVRGLNGEGAGSVIAQVTEANRYRFDQSCRVKAVQLASELAVPTHISINFLPNAVYRPELCIRTTLDAAERYGFPVERIIFEFTEDEQVRDKAHLRAIVDHYKQQGFLTAIDDFGAGYSGIDLLCDIHTDLVKLDMAMIRNLDQDRRRQTVVRHIVSLLRQLDIRIIAEGVETLGELSALRDAGVELIQGYLLAKPAFRAMAPFDPRVLD